MEMLGEEKFEIIDEIEIREGIDIIREGRE